ncbi:MAG TPA: serine/threonine-protein kinase, partial [Polyangiaceae bacterium]
MDGESFKTGDVVSERYEILELLGKGGMGEVYAARDRKLRRRVAIKTILQSATSLGSVGTERLRAEAEMLAQLAHPGIVAVHDVLEESDRVLLVMELIEGTSLRERLKSGPLPVHEVIDVVSAMGSALAAAHAHGLIHRDVKPDNVMIR